jgi:deazaflavin-dependent oxidoreductase (nitroreductase family)
MNAQAVTQRSAHGRSRRSFWRHFVEMVVVMLFSMVVFGAAVTGIFAFLGHGYVLHYAALRGGLMTMYMVVGMVLWMRHRHHGRAAVIEMSAAMTLPYVVLVGPFTVGWFEEGPFLGAMHVLMLPSMYVAMMYRRSEYERDHPKHHGRTLARFNRRIANPVTRHFAGRVPPFSLVRHRGRVSGNPYTTPAWAFSTQDGVVFALLYGDISDWPRNVLASREVEVVRSGATRTYERPRLVSADEGLRLIPRSLRPLFRVLRVRHFLRMSASA